MTGKTKIEWTDKSSNPLRAYNRETGKRGWFCVHASTGCTNCYAERRNRWIGNGLHYKAQNLSHVRFEMDEKELRSWAKLPAGTKVFPFDMTDLFQDAVPEAMIDQAFAAMALSPATFQVLTKRADRLRLYMQPARGEAWAIAAGHLIGRDPGEAPDWPLPGVWLGVSVEDQDALWRVDALKDTPAAVRFVSFEPLLEDLGALLLDGIHWAVWGGESGPGARPCHLDWIRSGVRQCRVQGVATFVKQFGHRPIGTCCDLFGAMAPHDSDPHPLRLKDSKGGDLSELPGDWPREFPG